MKKFLKKFVGLILLVAGLAGLALAGLAGFFAWNYQETATQAIDSRLGLVNQALTTTDQTLRITKESLNATLTSLVTAQEAISATATTMQSIDPLIKSSSLLLSDNLPQTVSMAREALLGAQASAKLMDDVLKALTVFNRDLYQPATPLNESLKQLADSLEPLPATFTNASLDIRIARNDMQTTQQSISQIVANIDGVQSNLAHYGQLIDDYRTQNLVLQNQITEIQTQLPELMNYLVWGAWLLLGWIALAQFGLIVQGIYLLF